MEETWKVIKKVNKEYKALTGRSYDFIETYNMDDADAAILCLGSTAGTAKAVARKMRDGGKKVGVIEPCVYRPFPAEQILEAVENLKALAVLDRACSFGAPFGALCSDVLSILYGEGRELKVFNGIFGLGGRDITPFDIESVFNEALEVAKTGVVKRQLRFIGVRD